MEELKKSIFMTEASPSLIFISSNIHELFAKNCAKTQKNLKLKLCFDERVNAKNWPKNVNKTFWVTFP